MKNVFAIFLFVITLLSSCTTETYFNIGLRATPGLKGYTKKLYALAQKENPYDVVIVPGIPYNPNSTSSIMRMRILWAKHLYDNGLTRNIIFSGSAVYSPFIEGIAMKVTADSLGIPSAHTFSETHAEHSTENVYYSWKMAKAMGFKKIAVATDPFQSIALRGFIKKYCPDVELVPMVVSKLMIDVTEIPIIDPTGALVSNFISLPDRETLQQRFACTRGKRVMQEVEQEKRIMSSVAADFNVNKPKAPMIELESN